MDSWAVVLAEAIISWTRVSVVSSQVRSYARLVQDGLLGLISELARHQFCCSLLAKASHKANYISRG